MFNSPASDSPRFVDEAAEQQAQEERVDLPRNGWKRCLIGLGAVLALTLSACSWEVVAEEDVPQQDAEPQTEEELLILANARILDCDLIEETGVVEVEVEFTNPLDVEAGVVVIEVDILDAFDDVQDTANFSFTLEPGQTAKERSETFGIRHMSLSSCELARAFTF